MTNEINNRTSASRAVRIGIVVGTTRPGRKAADVARWVIGSADASADDVELVVLDPAEFALPLLDEPVAAAFGQYLHGHTKAWAAAVAACDGFVFVTPEYNHSFPAALKNAIDYLYAEWQHKPAGMVGYGITGGVRAVEALRLVLIEAGALPIAAQVALSVFDDITYADETDPASPFQVTVREYQIGAVQALLAQLVAYAHALAPLRSESHAIDAVEFRS